MKGFQHILEIKNPYWSRVSNKELLERANVKLNGEFDNKELRRLSTRLIEIQLALYARIIRSGEDDPVKKIPITEQGERV